jgi:hypothetical protein
MVMKAYPIWVEAYISNYRDTKFLGIRDSGVFNIFVGSSAKNSHRFCTLALVKNEDKFELQVDGRIIKSARVIDGELHVE